MKGIGMIGIKMRIECKKKKKEQNVSIHNKSIK